MMTPVDAQSTDDVGVHVHTFMHRRSNFNQTRQARGAVSVSPSRAVNPKPSIARVNRRCAQSSLGVAFAGEVALNVDIRLMLALL